MTGRKKKEQGAVQGKEQIKEKEATVTICEPCSKSKQSKALIWLTLYAFPAGEKGEKGEKEGEGQ